MNRANLYHIKAFHILTISFLLLLCNCKNEKNGFLSDCNSKKDSYKLTKNFFENINQNKAISLYEEGNLYRLESYGVKCNCDRNCITLQYDEETNNALINNTLYKSSQLDSVLEKEIYSNINRDIRFGFNLEIPLENKQDHLSEKQINTISILINAINCSTNKVRNKLAVELHNKAYNKLNQVENLEINKKASKCINIFFN